MPERIDLHRVDDPRDVVHRAVACLAQGGVVALPTETGFEIVAGAIHPQAVDRLQSISPPRTGHLSGRPTLFLRGSAEASDWALVATLTGRRLASRGWPGPITLVFPISQGGLADRLPGSVRSFAIPDGKIALRSPSHKMIREILRLLPIPLIQIEAPLSVGGQAPTVDALENLASLDMILDPGPFPSRGLATVVEIGAEGWTIARPGAMPERAIDQLSGMIFLFVCTGNTCRSPMAEALCKALIARRIGCELDDLIRRGYVVLSAGVSAADGMPAASHAVEVVKSRGGSLDGHASRRVAPELVRHADHIIAMTGDHLDVLLDRVPDVADRARLLDAGGDDIDDPVGSDLATYQRTARLIEKHLTQLLDELGVGSS